MGKPIISTRQKILNTSGDLFNYFGIEAVSLGQIAETLSISPGNLTYHFKKKSDLISAHISQFEEALVEAVATMPIGSSPREFTRAYLKLLDLTLQYKYLFVGANYIIQNKLVSRKEYDHLIGNTKSVLVNQFKSLINMGFMKEITAPVTIDMLVDGVWWQWLGWLLAIQIESKASGRKMLAEGAIHILFLSHHYVDEEYFMGIHNELMQIISGRQKRMEK